MKNWNNLAENQVIEKARKALEENGINTILVEGGEEAVNKIKDLIPAGAEVFNMTSVTLDTLGIPTLFNESDNYKSIRNQLLEMDKSSQQLEMNRLGSAPEWAVGSVHAVTMNGEVLIASNTGSQLPAYAYGATNVIWLVSTKKIVENLESGISRIYEHVLPQESERARKAYGVEGSNVSKLLIISKEVVPNRITLIFIPQDLGY